MIPITITAHLHTPPVIREPVLFDGVLLGGLGASMGAGDPSGWVDPEIVCSHGLPLARVETTAGWWYAASQATPYGPEQTHHTHRRMPAEHYQRWTGERSTTFSAGPDKGLRVRLFTRPSMLAIRWTCVGDPAVIRRLLTFVGGIGNRTTHGWGQVARWEVAEGGPGLDAYRQDVALRHLPADLELLVPGDAMIAPKRLVPPYWRRDNTRFCWYVPARFEDPT